MAVRPGPPDDGRVRTVFLGSGAFAVPALQRLAANPLVRIVAVVTRAAAPGRPLAGLDPDPDRRRRGRPRHPPGPHPAAAPASRRRSPRSSRCGRTSPCSRTTARSSRRRCSTCAHGALNLHPSALPRFRGAAPVPAAILAGDPETAVTLMRMDPGLDTGPIVAQERVPSTGRSTPPSSSAAWPCSARTCSTGRSPAGSTARCPRCRRRTRASCSPGRSGARTAASTRRGPPPTSSAPSAPTSRGPGTFLEVDGERLVVGEASVAPSEAGDAPGAIVRHGREPALATADGRLVLHR